MSENEITFSVQESPEGGYVARALHFSISIQADSLEALKVAVRGAISCHFETPYSGVLEFRIRNREIRGDE